MKTINESILTLDNAVKDSMYTLYSKGYRNVTPEDVAEDIAYNYDGYEDWIEAIEAPEETEKYKNILAAIMTYFNKYHKEYFEEDLNNDNSLKPWYLQQGQGDIEYLGFHKSLDDIIHMSIRNEWSNQITKSTTIDEMDKDLYLTMKKYGEFSDEEEKELDSYFNITEAIDDEEELLNDSETFQDYVNSEISNEARCKEDWMDPQSNGTGAINNGECDIMWVSQGDCTSQDFDTLLNCFGEYYGKAVVGKTYSVVMKCRSYPGYGNYMKRLVTYIDENNWKQEVSEDSEEILYTGDIELKIILVENEKVTNDLNCKFKITCEAEDINAEGNTIKEVKSNFENELDYLDKNYGEPSPGYAISKHEITLEDNKYINNDDVTAEDAYFNYIELNAKDDSQEAYDEASDRAFNEADDDELVLTQGTYQTYQKLKEN